MDKHIWHGVMAMVLAVCFAAVVQSAQPQMTAESIPRDEDIAAKALASEKFALKFPFKKGKAKEWKRGFDIGWQIGQCLGNYDNVKDCVDKVKQVFTTGDVYGLNGGCCDAFTGITEDCLAMKVIGYLPQVRVPMATVSAYCTFAKTVHGFIG